MTDQITYQGTVVGPSYVYNYDNNSVISQLDLKMIDDSFFTTIAVPEYLNNTNLDISIAPGYKISFVVDKYGYLIDLNIIEMNSNTNTSFNLYPRNCPACGTPLTRLVYYRGIDKPHIARICFSRGCTAFMTNNIINALKALQLDLNYQYMVTVIDSAMNKGILPDVSAFFRVLYSNTAELIISNMNSELLYAYRDMVVDKLRSDIRPIHILQLMNIPLTEDVDLVTMFCQHVPVLLGDVSNVTVDMILQHVYQHLTEVPTSPVSHIANSVYVFLQVNKNKETVEGMLQLVRDIHGSH